MAKRIQKVKTGKGTEAAREQTVNYFYGGDEVSNLIKSFIIGMGRENINEKIARSIVSWVERTISKYAMIRLGLKGAIGLKIVDGNVCFAKSGESEEKYIKNLDTLMRFEISDILRERMENSNRFEKMVSEGLKKNVKKTSVPRKK